MSQLSRTFPAGWTQESHTVKIVIKRLRRPHYPVLGLQDNDILSGHGGDDIVEGNEGDDKVLGNAGDDVLQGNVVDDKMDDGGYMWRWSDTIWIISHPKVM